MIEFQIHSSVAPVKYSKYPYLGECISVADSKNKLIVLFSAPDTGVVVYVEGSDIGWNIGDQYTQFDEKNAFQRAGVDGPG